MPSIFATTTTTTGKVRNPMEAENTEKGSPAAERALKKATRRAAFIQEVAEAVYALGIQRQQEVEAKQRALNLAGAEQERLREKAEDAVLRATSPLEALYCLNHAVQVAENKRWASAEWPASRAKQTLRWAVSQGILPAGTVSLPDTEEQFLAYATWQIIHDKA